MIEAFSPKTSDKAFALGGHIGMPAHDHLDVSSAGNIVEQDSELSITIANKKSRSGIELGRNTTKRILLESGVEPAPERGQGMPWKTFLKAH